MFQGVLSFALLVSYGYGPVYGQGILRCPGECEYQPCGCCEEGMGLCKECHANGCDQCDDSGASVFKRSYSYYCEYCADIFGDACNFCQDNDGCGQCKDFYDQANNIRYERVRDSESGLYYCKPQNVDVYVASCGTTIPNTYPDHDPDPSCVPEPTWAPTQPTLNPSMNPTQRPSSSPSDRPSDSPTNRPSNSPTDRPSNSPTDRPSNSPTDRPSKSPTDRPSNSPTDRPSRSPTDKPSNSPSDRPSESPTNRPSNSPTDRPSNSPTDKPSESPIDDQGGNGGGISSPSNSPTDRPSMSPIDYGNGGQGGTGATSDPSNSPTDAPSDSPTDRPTRAPTVRPTKRPTTRRPTNAPTGPTNSPTDRPSDAPTAPTDSPTNRPSHSPTEWVGGAILYPCAASDAHTYGQIMACDHKPCDCDNEIDLHCGANTCHSNGCDQCESGYFKLDYWFKCHQCQEIFGDACDHCADFIGCQQCKSPAIRVQDPDCGFFYCKSEE